MWPGPCHRRRKGPGPTPQPQDARCRRVGPEKPPNVAGARFDAESRVRAHAAIKSYCVTFLLESTYRIRPQTLPSQALPGVATATEPSQAWTIRRPPGRAALAEHISLVGPFGFFVRGESLAGWILSIGQTSLWGQTPMDLENSNLVLPGRVRPPGRLRAWLQRDGAARMVSLPEGRPT